MKSSTRRTALAALLAAPICAGLVAQEDEFNQFLAREVTQAHKVVGELGIPRQ